MPCRGERRKALGGTSQHYQSRITTSLRAAYRIFGLTVQTR